MPMLMKSGAEQEVKPQGVSMYKKEYVLGFMFSLGGGHVAMVNKQRPDWQKGKWNGIGGHVEKDEPYADAMAREFKEETGVNTVSSDWRFVGWMRCDREWQCAVFTMESDKCLDVTTTTDERVWAMSLTWLGLRADRIIENIPALVELCRMPPGAPSNHIPLFILDYTK